MKTLKIGVMMVAALLVSSLGTSTLVQLPKDKTNQKELDCLAKNIYHEARGEPLAGQIAVAQVTLNRVRSNEFQSSICSVVYANKQFSWTNKQPKKILDSKAWKNSLAIAESVLTKQSSLPNFKALYFHTKQVNPKWNRKKQVVAKIGNHIFYS